MVLWTTWPGTRPIANTPNLYAERCQTVGDCTICSATSGNGWLTGTTQITISGARIPTPQDRRLVKIAYCAAVFGLAFRAQSVHQNVLTTPPPVKATVSGSGAPVMSDATSPS